LRFLIACQALYHQKITKSPNFALLGGTQFNKRYLKMCGESQCLRSVALLSDLLIIAAAQLKTESKRDGEETRIKYFNIDHPSP
jgi:hypothetical protein